MKPLFLGCLVLLLCLLSCTVTFAPRQKGQVRLAEQSQESTGSLKITYRTEKNDTIGRGQFFFYTEATYNTLTDARVSLLSRKNIPPDSTGAIQFVIDDLNPGNYVVDITAWRANTRLGGIGGTFAVQVTAGKQREYEFGEGPRFSSPPDHMVARKALRKVIGIANCVPPEEGYYENDKIPELNEKFVPFADKILRFESSFNDTVWVYVNDRFMGLKALEDTSNGLAGQMNIRASAGATVSIRTTPNDCTEFNLKDGYKYIYILRYPVHKWHISYSNFNKLYSF